MRIIQPSYEIIDPAYPENGIALLRKIERYARYSHRSEEAQTQDSWKRFLQLVVMSKGDWSVTEHCTATVIVRVDRGTSHQLVRHRIGSYTQESTRFVNYKDVDIEFVQPVFRGSRQDTTIARSVWEIAMISAEQNYKDLILTGQPPQMARSVLPNATATSVVITYNLRNWRFFFQSRTCHGAQDDFKRVTVPLLRDFQRLIPLLYDDIVPEEQQSVAFSKPR